MKKIYLILIIAAFAFADQLSAQTLRLIRTDVDSARWDFVTATYLFGIDIVAEGLENTTAVSFSLKYNQTDYVKFSEWKYGVLGDSSSGFVKHEVNTSAKEGTVYAGLSSSEPEGRIGYDNPLVIHLEFAVSQTAPNNQNVVFSFVTAQANISTDSGKVKLNLETEPTIYKIHSFIDVWPGDADNSGSVNDIDFINVDKYFEYGASVKKTKAFKRAAASTLWLPQSVLAWDNMEAGYADCDGNGVVNASDFLIIYLNFNKNQFKAKKDKNNPQLNARSYFERELLPSDSKRLIPVYVNSTQEFIAAEARFDWSAIPNAKILGFVKGNMFNTDNNLLISKINPDKKYADIVFGSMDSDIAANNSGILFYVAVDGMTVPNTYSPDMTVLKGITKQGSIIPLQKLTSVNDDVYEESPHNLKIIADKLIAKNYSGCELKLYDITGRVLFSTELNADYQEILLEDIPAGAYFARISGKKQAAVPIYIAH